MYFKYFFILFVFSVFYAGIFLAPYFMSIANDSNFFSIVSTIIYQMYSVTCHQLPERSYFIFDNKMTVCARCFGIYTGFLAGLIVYPLFMKYIDYKNLSRWYLIISLLPMAFDGTSQLFGFRESFNLLRLFTGLTFGFTVVFYVIPVFLDVMDKTTKEDIKSIFAGIRLKK